MGDLDGPPNDRVAPRRVLIVDDSRSMRLWLRHILDNDLRLTVVGEAADAVEARAAIKELEPDVITLDIDMPGMSGIDFLDRLMRLHPMPVVMVSGATARGSAATIKSLSLGAIDCIVKPSMNNVKFVQRDLVRRVYAAACSRTKVALPLVENPICPRKIKGRMPIILMGASTGGVAALECVLQTLNPIGPPIVIVQHMPSEFLQSFAEMLDRHLAQEVGLLRDGMPLAAGQVMLAPSVGRMQSQVSQVNGRWQGRITQSSGQFLHHPSVDVLFSSARLMARDTIAVLLTGLGRDGAEGMKALRDAGGQTIGQDEESSVVYGMPRAAFEQGAVQAQLPLDQIGGAVNNRVQIHQRRSALGR